MLVPFLSCTFKKICSRLSTKSSIVVLQLEVSRIYMNYKADAALSGYHMDATTLEHMAKVAKESRHGLVRQGFCQLLATLWTKLSGVCIRLDQRGVMQDAARYRQSRELFMFDSILLAL